MFSKRSLEGYLLIDNRGAPSLSVAEAAKVGKDVIGSGVTGLFETAVLTCCHCQVQVAVNPGRTRSRNWCSKCDRYVCDAPVCNAGCSPVVRLLDIKQSAAEKAVTSSLTGFGLRCSAPPTPRFILP